MGIKNKNISATGPTPTKHSGGTGRPQQVFQREFKKTRGLPRFPNPSKKLRTQNFSGGLKRPLFMKKGLFFEKQFLPGITMG